MDTRAAKTEPIPTGDDACSGEATGPFQSHLSFMLTRRCNVRCRHCCVDALPANAGEGDIAADDLEHWLLQTVRLDKVRQVSLTGGEPFLRPDLVATAVRLAAEHDRAVGVVTSGFWAASPERARRTLAPLVPWSAGLTLSLSVDRFHQEYVPPAYIRNAAEAALALGIRRVKIKLGYLGTSPEESRARLQADLGPLPVAVESQMIHRTGRAAHQVERSEFGAGPEPYPDVRTRGIPCRMADCPLVTPAGAVYACCGVALLLKHPTPLLLGNLHDQSLDAILERSETNTVLHIIRLYGPQELAARLGVDAEIGDCDANSLCALCLAVLGSPARVAMLERRLQQPEWRPFERQVAVRRLVWRGEAAMLRRVRP